MKRPRFLYDIAIAAAIGILVVSIGYTMVALPKHTPKQPDAVKVGTPNGTTTATGVTTGTVKKDGCRCCAERRTRRKKIIQQARTATP